MMAKQKITRFVKPQTTRLDISDGDWIEVRHELTVGEARRAMARTVKTMRADGRIEPDLEQVGKAEVIAYIVDWSLTDEQDKRVPFSEAAIENLTVDTFDEIERAVRAHISAVEDARKNARSASSSK